MSKADFIAFRRSLGRTPPLHRMTVRARGLDFAVWTSPPVDRATPLLLVNGGLIHDHALLWPALSPLAEGRQVILYDQRGRGLSQAPADPSAARIEDDADDIPALRRALGIRQWDVLGHSWGGGIAMLAVAGDLAGTRRLVTVNAVGPTSAWMAPLHVEALRRLDGADRAAVEALGGDRLHDPDPAVHGAHNKAMYRAWFADGELADYLSSPLASSVTGSAVAARLRREGYDWRARLRALSTPTLVLHGERDALSPTVARELAELLPRARSELLADAGHMPFWEAPHRFFALAGDFLTTASPRPAAQPFAMIRSLHRSPRRRLVTACVLLVALVPVSASVRAPRGRRAEASEGSVGRLLSETEPVRKGIRRRIAERGVGTYIGEMLANRDSALARWPDRRGVPLRVWVQPTTSLEDWDAAYVREVRDAFREWDALRLPVRFTFTGDSARADVHVTFIDHFNEPISGRTKWVRDDDWWITDADIILATHHRDGDALDTDAMRAMTLHEVGHLLGLDHTTDDANIMAPRVRVRALSAADRATVRLLYALPPGAVR